MRILSLLFLFFLPAIIAFPAEGQNLSKIPANKWTLLDKEDDSGGKRFARAVFAGNVGKLYLWGTGGKKPARNVYLRYELESFDPESAKWKPAFPKSKAGEWTAEKFPPFRIYGQSGPDGLKWDEGPRLQVVGGYHSTNRIRWWDFNGVRRPSPVLTFNMACWDSKRKRILFYSDGCTFALDPKTNTWRDLKAKNYPKTCRSVAWASMCYDPSRDRVLLFGGGLATNPKGGAPTWIYDCKENIWRRPSIKLEPPLRCNAPIVYDAINKTMILFGGYNQAAALNDTWVFDCKSDQWEQRTPKISPPPMYNPATATLPGGGRVLVCGFDARKVKRTNQRSSSAIKETWIYDVAKNQWTPIHGSLRLPGYEWLTADSSDKHGVVLMVAFGQERRTYAFRYNSEKGPSEKLELAGAPPGTIAWKYPEQKLSLEQAPPPSPKEHARFLGSLPVNKFIDAKPPGLLISKTWSTAVIDSDRSEIIYTGGGHSGYSGNDFARYDIANNRWSLDFPPRFPPFLEGTNAGIYGWSYGMIPFSQHTYLWYSYDPVSKTVVYCARPSLRDGAEIQLGNDSNDTFRYQEKKHGYASWVYDSAQKKIYKPSFGRPFANPWHLCVLGTPKGTYAMAKGRLYKGTVSRENGSVKWKLVDSKFPKQSSKIKYHYEFQPLVHDTKRDRLILLKGDSSHVNIFTRPLGKEGGWKQTKTKGSAPIGREAVYIPKHDVVLWLGDKLCAFDCATNQMREVEVDLPKGRYGHECAMVYDEKHDVCIALIPSRFSGPMQTFLFRFESKSAE